MKVLNDKKIDYVYHIADIHLRNLKRHKEYRLVFNKFLSVLDNKVDNSILYIGGDIAHAKTEMSPELVREVSSFLKECADRIPTFVIAGNHDCNLLNPSRLDVLSPIVESLNHPNLYYMRDTGVWGVGDLTIGVFSIFDKKENWPKGTDIKGDNKIVFFHGPVNRSKTDVGYIVSSKSFPMDLFDGYHMGMFGDIHKRQILQDYNEQLNHPTLVYCGSLLQQNHGELLDNHGYLLWDIKNRTFTEHNIYNEYGYLTIDIVNGEIPQWVYDEVGIKLPKIARVRLRTENTDSMQLQSVITELKSIFDDMEVSITRMDTLNSLKSSNQLNSSLLGNVRDVVFQNKLITEYLKSTVPIDQNNLDKICELNIQFNNKLNSNETFLDRVLWIPKRFEFSNMFSYGEDNKIDFDGAEGLIGLFAQNAQGKSSIWDALSFCIFDKCSRAFKAQYVMNNQKDNFYCKFHFQIDDTDYFVERSAKRSKHNTVRVDVNFWRERGGIEESLNGEHRRDTNDKIEQFIGKYDDFILTSLSLQGNNSLFIDKSQSERKDILSQFIGIDVFDKLYVLVADENRKVNSLLEKYEETDYTEKLIELTDNIEIQKEKYEDTEGNLQKLKDEKSIVDSEYIELNKQLIPIDTEDLDIDKLLVDKENTEIKITNNTNELVSINERLEKLNELNDNLTTLKNNFGDISNLYANLQDLRNTSSSIHTELDKFVYKLNSNEETLQHLNEHEYNSDCHICVKNFSNVIEKKETIENSITEYKVNIENSIQQLKSVETSIQSLSHVDNEWVQYKDTLNKLNTVEKEFATYKQTKTDLNFNTHKLKTKLDSIERNISLFYKNEDIIKSNSKIEDDMIVVKSKIKSYETEIDKRQSLLLNLKASITELETELRTVQKSISEFEELSQSSKLYELYLDSIGRDGVPYTLISKAIPAIEAEVNNILTQIVDFVIELEMDGKNINAHIVYGDQKWPLEMSSGMERFIGGLAIRIALINLCNLPRPNFLIVDEGLGTLDSENLQSAFLLFSYLKTQFDFIILISHLDIARDFVDKIMEIKKKDGFSYLNF
jgi:DNA repair exonuclease SbcCD ATPase subunit